MPIQQYQRNQLVTIPTTTMVPGGNAIGRLPDGRPVFVKGGAPQEEAEVRLTRIKRDFAEAIFERAIKPSPDRVQAPFPPEALSGADWHYLSYEAQLAAKQQTVAELLQKIGKLEADVLPVIPADQHWRYRNKVELTFGSDEHGHVALGFHKHGRFDEIIPTADIALFPEVGQKIIQAIIGWANREQLTVFNPRRHEGSLRNLVIRRGEHTKDLICHLVTTPGSLPEASLITALGGMPLSGLVWSENGSAATIVRVDNLHLLSGTTEMTERFLDQEIHYHVDSFFQTNTLMAEKLATTVLEQIDQRTPNQVIDGYAGVGGFGLFVAQRGTEVISIESHPASSADAIKNAERLHLRDKMAFVNDPMETYLQTQFLADQQDDTLLIIDPPRSGLHPKALHAILASKLKHVVYVSCGPATLARDLASLKDVYQLTLVQPFDLFPQTSHVETVVMLDRM